MVVKQVKIIAEEVRSNLHIRIASYYCKYISGVLVIDFDQPYGGDINTVDRYLKRKGYKTKIVSSRRIEFEENQDIPLYKKGDVFSKDDFKYRILGVKESIADFQTGRKGLSYIIKDNKCSQSYTVPCWYLERNNEKFGYVKIKGRK